MSRCPFPSQRRLGENAVSFETAWGAAEPVFDALAARFPGVAFTVAYASEDVGSHAGLFRYSGTRELHRLLSGPAAARLWFSLHPEAEPADYGFDPVTFVSVGGGPA